MMLNFIWCRAEIETSCTENASIEKTRFHNAGNRKTMLSTRDTPQRWHTNSTGECHETGRQIRTKNCCRMKTPIASAKQQHRSITSLAAIIVACYLHQVMCTESSLTDCKWLETRHQKLNNGRLYNPNSSSEVMPTPTMNANANDASRFVESSPIQ